MRPTTRTSALHQVVVVYFLMHIFSNSTLQSATTLWLRFAENAETRFSRATCPLALACSQIQKRGDSTSSPCMRIQRNTSLPSLTRASAAYCAVGVKAQVCSGGSGTRAIIMTRTRTKAQRTTAHPCLRRQLNTRMTRMDLTTTTLRGREWRQHPLSPLLTETVKQKQRR